jgi:hypothetical protein
MSVCMEQLGSHLMGFHVILYKYVLSIYRIQVSLTSDNNTQYFIYEGHIHCVPLTTEPGIEDIATKFEQ